LASLLLQGKGIKLVQGEAGVVKGLKEMEGGSSIVVQQYLQRPFLVNGLKFDLRIYVLVLCCDPLRVFSYKEGLVR
jgi:tubulin polyglutamylase TTLL6/13